MRSEDFEPFLSKNELRIYHYLLRFVDVEADAQDLLQNVFIAFYERLDDIDDKTALAYIYRMAHNMAINWQKHNRRHILKAPEDFSNVAAPPTHTNEPDYRELNDAIATLPPKLASVIHLQYYDHLSYKEISERLGISVKAVESLLVRAKKLLRKKIVQYNGGDHVLPNR